jgi:hypothetical protein
MKNIHFKPSQFLFLILAISTIFSCKDADTTPDNSLAGTYQSINNPLLCAFPTMSQVKIQAIGDKYELSFLLNKSSVEKLQNIAISKKDSSTILTYNGAKIGTFEFMKYLDDVNGKFKERETMVLMVRFDEKNKHYEYMGRK